MQEDGQEQYQIKNEAIHYQSTWPLAMNNLESFLWIDYLVKSSKWMPCE